MKWMDIKTAPTDGTKFIAYKPGHVGIFTALILESDHPDCEYDGGVHSSWDHSYVDGVTHWMPLPQPPQDFSGE